MARYALSLFTLAPALARSTFTAALVSVFLLTCNLSKDGKDYTLTQVVPVWKDACARYDILRCCSAAACNSCMCGLSRSGGIPDLQTPIVQNIRASSAGAMEPIWNHMNMSANLGVCQPGGGGWGWCRRCKGGGGREHTGWTGGMLCRPLCTGVISLWSPLGVLSVLCNL
jgi:hypothetical protein